MVRTVPWSTVLWCIVAFRSAPPQIEDSEHPIQSKKKLTVRGAEMPLCMTLCVAILSWQHSSSILCRPVAFRTILWWDAQNGMTVLKKGIVLVLISCDYGGTLKMV